MKPIENFLQEGLLDSFNQKLLGKLSRTLEVLKMNNFKTSILPGSIKKLVYKIYKIIPSLSNKIVNKREFLEIKTYVKKKLSNKIIDEPLIDSMSYFSLANSKLTNEDPRTEFDKFYRRLKVKLDNEKDIKVLKWTVITIYASSIISTVFLLKTLFGSHSKLPYIYIIVATILFLTVVFELNILSRSK